MCCKSFDFNIGYPVVFLNLRYPVPVLVYDSEVMFNVMWSHEQMSLKFNIPERKDILDITL